MSTKILKYNPSFLNDDELVESFVVRQASLALLLEVIRDNVHETNQHVLVIGPRGSGKTTLLRRVAAAVRQTLELDARWFPLPFGEESYEVASAGQFWLEAVHYLGVQTGDPKWSEIYDELLLEPDEKRLGQRCLSRLLDFADSCGKRLLLLVENLNLMLTEQLNDDDAWALRGTLMHEPRLMLLGSATSRFDAISSKDKAMYELFRVIELSRLSVVECRTVWNRVTGQDIPEAQARAVQILTGGNPRLLTILSIFGANRSFRSLLEDLSLLVDEHTDYFKSNFESLPPTERKVFACLATLWEDSSASDVARAARMTTSQASSLLKRLEGRGAVKATAQNKGKKKYQLAERLYNVYYLMRRGQDGGRVRAVVNFMVQFYGKKRLHEAVADIAREACGLEAGQRRDHYRAMQLLCARPEARDGLGRIRAVLPPEFLQLPDIPEELKRVAELGDEEFSPELVALSSEVKQALEDELYADAEKTLRKTVELKPEYAWAWAMLGAVLVDNLDRPEEGADCLRKAVELMPDYARAWGILGEVLVDKLDRPEEGADCLRKAVELAPDDAGAWTTLGWVLAARLDRPEEAEECLRKALELAPDDAGAWATLGWVLAAKLDRPEEAEECLRKALELDADNAEAWATLGEVLSTELDQPEEGADCLRKALERMPDGAGIWAKLGEVLADKLGRPEEAEECLRKAVELKPDFVDSWAKLGEVLADTLDRPEGGEGCLRKALEFAPDDAGAWAKLGDVLAAKLDRPEEGEKCLEKALELSPDDAGAWITLSGVLTDKLDRPEEGEECLRKALKLQPGAALVWAKLGEVLSLKLDQPEKGEECLRKALKLEPGGSRFWAMLGIVLAYKMDQPKESADCLRRAVALEPDFAGSWVVLGNVLANILNQPEEGANCLRKAVELDAKLAQVWNTLACMLADKPGQLSESEACVRKALAIEDSPYYHGTLSRVLALRGNIPEALQHAGIALQHPDAVRSDIQESTDVLTTAAALGYGQEALDLLVASPSLPDLEPLAAGLRQYLGLDVQAPQEVKEIGEDIVKRIEHWKDWHRKKGTTGSKS